MSFIFHAIFGLLMFEFGMLGVILIFIVDRLLSIRKENYSYLYPLGCLVLSAIIGTLVYFILLSFNKNNKRDPIVRLYLTFQGLFLF